MLKIIELLSMFVETMIFLGDSLMNRMLKRTAFICNRNLLKHSKRLFEKSKKCPCKIALTTDFWMVAYIHSIANKLNKYNFVWDNNRNIHHLWYLQLRNPLKMSLREPIWWRLSRITTEGSSISHSSVLHCSARLERYCRRSCLKQSKSTLSTVAAYCYLNTII